MLFSQSTPEQWIHSVHFYSIRKLCALAKKITRRLRIPGAFGWFYLKSHQIWSLLEAMKPQTDRCTGRLIQCWFPTFDTMLRDNGTHRKEGTNSILRRNQDTHTQTLNHNRLTNGREHSTSDTAVIYMQMSTTPLENLYTFPKNQNRWSKLPINPTEYQDETMRATWSQTTRNTTGHNEEKEKLRSVTTLMISSLHSADAVLSAGGTLINYSLRQSFHDKLTWWPDKLMRSSNKTSKVINNSGIRDIRRKSVHITVNYTV